MTNGAPDMRLALVNRPDNVALVRQALTGLALEVGMDARLLSDVKTAVSEACNNVVLHAYPGREGPLDVWACPDGDELSVVVSDRGDGIHPHGPEPSMGMQGVGLSLIQALTESVEFVGGAGEGTEVRMTFRSETPLDTERDARTPEADAELPPPPGETVVSACGKLIRPVLGSVVGVLAARAGFSVERLSDAQLLTDAVAAHARDAVVGRYVHTVIDTGERRLELRVGALGQGGADEVVRASGVGGLRPVIEQIADELAVERTNGHEQLRLAIVDAR